MLVFNEHKAKAHLSKILTLLESNDEIIIPVMKSQSRG